MLERPDGNKINLVNKSFTSNTEKDFRISLINESGNNVKSFARRYVQNLPPRVNINTVLFSQADGELFQIQLH